MNNKILPLISSTGVIYGSIEYAANDPRRKEIEANCDSLKKSDATIKDTTAPRSGKRQS